MQWIFALTLVFIILEYGYARYKSLHIYSGKENYITALIFAANYASGVYAAEIGRYIPISPAKAYNFASTYLRVPFLYELKWVGPDWLRLIILFLVVDFVYYSSHWLAHHIGLFWAGHFTHHTITKLNIISSHRDPIRVVKVGATIVWLPLAAQLPGTVGLEAYAFFLWISVYSTWLHCSYFPRIKCLEWVLNTPSCHRMHHSLSNQDRTMAVNFGGVLIVWDRMFGTYLPEAENRHVYGVQGFHQSDRLLPVLLYQWLQLFKGFFKKVAAVRLLLFRLILHLRLVRR